MTPFAPYVTDKIYEQISGEKESVHMESYPEAENKRIDETVEEGMKLAREIVEQSTKIRDEETYNLRWPAKRLVISTDEKSEKQLERFEDLIKEMANVKQLEFGEVASTFEAQPDYSSLGPRFGENADDVASKIENLEHNEIEQLQDTGTLEIEDYVLEEEDINVSSTTSENLGSKAFEKGEIFLELRMTEDIKEEAFVAEVIRAIQQKRKEEDLDVEDSVKLSFNGGNDVLESYETRIKERINLSEVSFDSTGYDHEGDVKFKGLKTTFSFSNPVN